jgi:hypothetical protein
MNSGAIKISKPIDDQPVVGKRAIWRAAKAMNDTLDPLIAANGT